MTTLLSEPTGSRLIAVIRSKNTTISSRIQCTHGSSAISRIRIRDCLLYSKTLPTDPRWHRRPTAPRCPGPRGTPPWRCAARPGIAPSGALQVTHECQMVAITEGRSLVRRNVSGMYGIWNAAPPLAGSSSLPYEERMRSCSYGRIRRPTAIGVYTVGGFTIQI
jgi:hypothetical protein